MKKHFDLALTIARIASRQWGRLEGNKDDDSHIENFTFPFTHLKPSSLITILSGGTGSMKKMRIESD